MINLPTHICVSRLQWVKRYGVSTVSIFYVSVEITKQTVTNIIAELSAELSFNAFSNICLFELKKINWYWFTYTQICILTFTYFTCCWFTFYWICVMMTFVWYILCLIFTLYGYITKEKGQLLRCVELSLDSACLGDTIRYFTTMLHWWPCHYITSSKHFSR